MRQDFRSYALIKGLAVLLTVALGVSACFGWLYCLINWESLFDDGDYTTSLAWIEARNTKEAQLRHLVEYVQASLQGEDLNYIQQQEADALTAVLDASATNFRFAIRDCDTGELLGATGGAGGDPLAGVSRISISVILVNVAVEPEKKEFSGLLDKRTGMTDWYDGNGTYLFTTSPGEDLPVLEPEYRSVQWVLECGVLDDLPAEDEFYLARENFRGGDRLYFYLAAGLTAGFLAGAVFLLCCAGRRRGYDTFVRSWQDKIPTDLYLCLAAGGILAAGTGAAVLFHDVILLPNPYHEPALLGVGSLLAAGFALLLAALMSLATRCKTRTLLSNTVIWRLLRGIGGGFKAIGRWWREVFGSWDMTRRAVLWFVFYLLGSIATLLLFPLAPFYQGAVLFCICRWTKLWRIIRAGTRAIVGGTPEAVIDTAGMERFPDLREHAEQLNHLGASISNAVEERMKGERFKAELITNVSHDLKTPLTSIINYVDLLKKEDLQDPKAAEYVEVLDRKSQRLKKLTEDLVEASKASTGVLAVNKERLGLVQLLTQALGEYQEKFDQSGLSPVLTTPDREVYVEADGRHLWRIMDNLLGNCVKYAMPRTRVYLDVQVWKEEVVLSVKNVSQAPLNIPADRLMERFVRGEESRTTEGSGLGLSIARSLTELQGGEFRLEIDGDLFKAVVVFPESFQASWEEG